MQDSEFRKATSIAIRALRAERGWNQRELCRRTGLSPAYLSEIESARKDASAEVLGRISDALGVRFDQFLWVILLAMRTGEVPGAHRRETALHLATEALQASPSARGEIEQFLEFLKFRDRPAQSDKLQEFYDETEVKNDDVTED